MKNQSIDNRNFLILITPCLFEKAPGEEVVHLRLWLIEKMGGKRKALKEKWKFGKRNEKDEIGLLGNNLRNP
jgi:hypothetical protein